MLPCLSLCLWVFLCTFVFSFLSAYFCIVYNKCLCDCVAFFEETYVCVLVFLVGSTSVSLCVCISMSMNKSV